MHWTSTTDLRTKLSALLEELHPGVVTELRVTMTGDVVQLTGEVASEACRSDAKRLALSFDGIFKVRNELVVAGYLVPASDDELTGFFDAPPSPPKRSTKSFRGDTARRVVARRHASVGKKPKPIPKPKPTPKPKPATSKTKTLAPPTGAARDLVDVVRHPSLSWTGNVARGARIEVSVDLVVAPSATEEILVGRFPSDWQTISVSVQLIAPWASEIVVKSPTVTIQADGTSTAASYTLVVGPDFDGSSAQVQAVFMHGTRICGHLAVDLVETPADEDLIDEDTADEAEPVTTIEAEEDRATARVRIVPDAAGPSLHVTITSTSDDVQTWIWHAATPGGLVPGMDRTDLGRGAKTFSDILLEACPGMDASRVGRMMDGIGEQLWRASPSGFQAEYARCRATLGSDFPIQFVSEDPHVPWEMMKPDLADARHLFMDHPVARWPLSRTSLLRERLGAGDLLSFVPRYAPGKGLPSAQYEGRWIAEELGAITMPPRTDSFFSVLDGHHPEPVSVIHFAGHGRADTGQRDGGIEMEDGYVGVLEVDQRRTVVGERCATLVVLNACEMSSGARMLGMNTGWAAAIAARQFGGLIAPLWEVEDAMALEMMKVALPDLLSGVRTLGDALRRARLAHHAASASAFAYLAHGDVMATFDRRASNGRGVP